jgi:tryptophanase
VDEYQQLQGGLVSYTEETWIPYQMHFVKCFADEHIHLGMTVTSRAGGHHAVIKKHINLCNVDLFTVQQRLYLMLEAQFNGLKGRLEMKKTGIRLAHKKQLISQNLVGKVCYAENQLQIKSEK